MDALQEIIGDYEVFLDDALEQIEDKGFDINDFSQIDHLCYRTDSEQNYQEKKSELEIVANLLTESTINGRLISTYRLIEPIFYDIWRIDVIELPAPKTNSPYDEGLEHLEMVIYDDIPTFLQKYTGMPFDLKSVDRDINPEVGLKLDGCSVRFHLMSLAAVIYLEQKLEQ